MSLWHGLAACGGWYVLVAAGAMLVAPVAAQQRDAATIRAQEAVARCQVQQIARAADPEMMGPQVALGLGRPAQTGPLVNYSRTRDGEWRTAKQVDRTDPWVRVLLLAPERPILLEAAVFLGDKPFRAAREELIDELLQHSNFESLVREAVRVPIDDGASDAVPEEDPADGANAADSAEQSAADGTAEQSISQSEDLESESDETVNLVDVRGRPTRSIQQRLVNYMASAEVGADREEIRWLLAEWTGGPELLGLGPAASWQRAGVTPLLSLIDTNQDRAIDPSELQQAPARLEMADQDGDGTLSIEEIAAEGTPTASAPRSYPLAVVLEFETDWQQLAGYLKEAYPERPEYQGDEPQQLLHRPADVTLRVAFGGDQPELALLSVKTPDKGTEVAFSASHDVLTLDQGSVVLEISAGTGVIDSSSTPEDTQVAVGAVVDGYPLFRIVDRNNDRRLTVRERRELPHCIAALDVNSDGTLADAEVPATIRFSITHGPFVHEQLSEPVAASRVVEVKPEQAAPAWFADMDRNRDGDLSRSEFLGTSDQFRAMDLDGDGLLNPEEVLQAPGKKEP